MKRIIIASVIAVTAVAAVVIGTASGASGSPTSAVITFDDNAHQVTLQIPDPPCDTSEPGCVWKFFLNEPKVSVDVATVYGSTGTLTISYPPNFCGIIQADAYVGPTANGPWVSKRGWQHQIPPVGDCEPPTPPSGGGTDTPPPGGPSSEPPPAATPVVPAPAPTPEPQAAAVAPVVAAATAAPSTTTTATTAPAKPATAPASLPFTGANLGPFVVLGLTLVTLGLCLVFLRRKRTL